MTLSQAHPNSRPLAVTFAVGLLSLSTAIAIIDMAVTAPWNDPLPTCLMFAFIGGVAALFIWFIFQGKNWARWVFLVVFALGLLLSPLSVQRLQGHPAADVVIYWVQLILQLIAATALVLRPARQWFGRTPPSRPHDPAA